MAEEFNNMTPPEPPKDENGKPMAPPEGGRPPMGGKPPKGDRPEPPKDENGNPVAPPEAEDGTAEAVENAGV